MKNEKLWKELFSSNKKIQKSKWDLFVSQQKDLEQRDVKIKKEKYNKSIFIITSYVLPSKIQENGYVYNFGKQRIEARFLKNSANSYYAEQTEIIPIERTASFHPHAHPYFDKIRKRYTYHACMGSFFWRAHSNKNILQMYLVSESVLNNRSGHGHTLDSACTDFGGSCEMCGSRCKTKDIKNNLCRWCR